MRRGLGSVCRWLALALLLAGTPLFHGTALAEPARVTLLYAHSTTELEDNQGRGGLARLAAIIRQERSTHDTVLVLHGGQSLAPSVLSFYDQGAHVIDLLNGLGIDAMAALNREFHHGDNILMSRAFEANFPVVTSNAVDRATGRPLEGLEDSAMLAAGPYRIGVLAATPLQTRDTTRSGRTAFRDPAAAVADKAKALRAAGADLIVVMTATSGNTHRAVIDTHAADIVLYQDRGRTVALDYDGRTLAGTVEGQAAWVLALDIDIDRAKPPSAAPSATPANPPPASQPPASRPATPLPIVWTAGVRTIDSAKATPDSVVEARAKGYLARLDSLLGMQVGRLDTPVDTRRESVRGGENAFANAVADALRAAMEADVALINGGAFRGDRRYPAGTMWTRRDIQTEFPYHDTAVLIEVTGQQLRDALEAGFSGIEQLQGRFPHLSGARITVDATRPAGHRVVDLRIAGKPLEPAGRYRLATGSYLAQGNDGYAALADAHRLVEDRDAEFVSTILTASIVRNGSFAPRLDGRLVVKR